MPTPTDGSGLMEDDRRRFLALHIAANAAYLAIVAMGVALVLLRTWSPRHPKDR